MRTPSSWDCVFIEMTEVISKRSKDSNTQVGAILVSPDKKRISMGFNGFISGVLETEKLWERPEKYRHVLHGEINAIINAKCDLTNWTLYVTIPCCSNCAKYVAQAGIKRVVFKNQPKSESQLDYEFAEKLFKSAGVQVEQFNE